MKFVLQLNSVNILRIDVTSSKSKETLGGSQLWQNELLEHLFHLSLEVLVIRDYVT